MEISKGSSDGRETVRGKFSDDIYMDTDGLVDFLRGLADEVEEGKDLELKTDDWNLPFSFRDDVKVEIDRDHDELEIEIEFRERKDTTGIEIG
ncbi:MAG: amphi-Trp domain-containing protein [Candidatus Aenigmatarchaeota archaeon]